MKADVLTVVNLEKVVPELVHFYCKEGGEEGVEPARTPFELRDHVSNEGVVAVPLPRRLQLGYVLLVEFGAGVDSTFCLGVIALLPWCKISREPTRR